LAGDPRLCECARPGSYNTNVGSWIGWDNAFDGSWIPGLMRLPGSHNTKGGGWIRARVIRQRKGRHSLERMESWLATAEPVLQRREGIRGAEQNYAIQQIKLLLASDRRCNGTATDRRALATDRWADMEFCRRRDAEEADESTW